MEKKYKVYFSLMILAFIQIMVYISMASKGKYLHEFLFGSVPFLAVVAPLLGLLVGVLDVRLSTYIVARLDPARLELDAERITSSQDPYTGRGIYGIFMNSAYVLGEEAIRGVVLTVLKKAVSVEVLIAAGTFLFIFSRSLPMYLRVVKMVDDFVLTLLFLWGGLLSAWLAHTFMNAYILWPIVKYAK